MKRDPCVELWCGRLTYSSYTNRYCQTRRIAALEGTKCAVNKVGIVSSHFLPRELAYAPFTNAEKLSSHQTYISSHNPL